MEGLISNLVDASEDVILVDWSTIHIVESYDEEGRLEVGVGIRVTRKFWVG
jgi:hypothetical protein